MIPGPAQALAVLPASPPGNAQLRTLLLGAGLSPEAMAKRLNALASELGLDRRLTEKTPYKWLRGSVPRDPWPAVVAHLLSSRLGIPVTVEDLGWSSSRACLALRPADSGLALPWTAQGARTAAITVASTDDLTFLPVTGMILTAPALGWLTAASQGGSVRAKAKDAGGRITAIEDVTASLRQLDERHGSALVLPLARVQLRSVADILADSAHPAAAGAGLHAAAAELLGLAGWLSFDHGRPGQAQRYWLAGLRAAHAAGDRPSGACILRFMSVQAGTAGHRQEAITLAEAARRGAGQDLTPRAAAILAFGAALAYARAGDNAATKAAIDDAGQELSRSGSPAREPGWTFWFDNAMAAAQTGTASLHLRDWDQARSLLAIALRGLDPARSRERAVIHARLGLACAGQGHPDAASEHGIAAARILAHGTSSARCKTYLRDLQQALSPYRKNQSVTDFTTMMNSPETDLALDDHHVGSPARRA
jgi:tetratricopeptide (TPR) repeat protein